MHTSVIVYVIIACTDVPQTPLVQHQLMSVLELHIVLSSMCQLLHQA